VGEHGGVTAVEQQPPEHPGDVVLIGPGGELCAAATRVDHAGLLAAVIVSRGGAGAGMGSDSHTATCCCPPPRAGLGARLPRLAWAARQWGPALFRTSFGPPEAARKQRTSAVRADRAPWTVGVAVQCGRCAFMARHLRNVVDRDTVRDEQSRLVWVTDMLPTASRT